jgi:Uncharacterized conserved protein
METLQKTALIFTIIGAINWGLIGLFDFNIIAEITGDMNTLRNIIYIIYGVAGLINIGILFNHFDDGKQKKLD